MERRKLYRSPLKKVVQFSALFLYNAVWFYPTVEKRKDKGKEKLMPSPTADNSNSPTI
jgi:hypothetical protein